MKTSKVAISEAKWFVEIRGKDLDRMHWIATSNSEMGFYDNSFMQIDEGTSQYARSSWEEFAKLNNIIDYEYKR